MSIYISPPFGNYIKNKHCTSIKGTFTWEKRSGLLVQIAKTLRKVEGGWRNKIGFRNKGMSNIKKCDTTSVYSIAALDSNWDPFYERIPSRSKIEINLGCPNVNGYTMLDSTLTKFCKRFPMLSVKLNPYVEDWEIIELYESGVRTFHLSNTIPTDFGGISGDKLREINLPVVERVANLNLQGSAIIAGGGIYLPKHVDQYRSAGATSFSLSTIWFTPWKVKKVIKKILNGKRI